VPSQIRRTDHGWRRRPGRKRGGVGGEKLLSSASRGHQEKPVYENLRSVLERGEIKATGGKIENRGGITGKGRWEGV